MNHNQHGAGASSNEMNGARRELASAPSPGGRGGVTSAAEERRAVRFFWVVLMLASSASVAGNVTHAVWNASGPAMVVAALAALVPPLSLLGATHSVGVLARVRTNSFTFWASMAITIAVVVCAFWLSFHALRSVAVNLAQVDPGIAWMMPVCIDLSIAGSTLALLSLSRPSAAAPTASQTARAPRASTNGSTSPASAATNGRAPAATSGVQDVVTRPRPVGGPDNNGHGRAGVALEERPTLVAVGQMVEAVTAAEMHPEAEARWSGVAETLVREKRTKIPARVVAKVLALREAQTPPSTIGRLLNVHHSAVRRILDGADDVDRSGSGPGDVPGMAQ